MVMDHTLSFGSINKDKGSMSSGTSKHNKAFIISLANRLTRSKALIWTIPKETYSTLLLKVKRLCGTSWYRSCLNKKQPNTNGMYLISLKSGLIRIILYNLQVDLCLIETLKTITKTLNNQPFHLAIQCLALNLVLTVCYKADCSPILILIATAQGLYIHRYL